MIENKIAKSNGRNNAMDMVHLIQNTNNILVKKYNGFFERNGNPPAKNIYKLELDISSIGDRLIA